MTIEANPWDGLSDDLKLEMMLEMLVDDELPQGQRAKLLTSLDAMPERWRDLAVRFLERQTEHASVKQFMASQVGEGKSKVESTPLRLATAGGTSALQRVPEVKWGRMRMAASVIVVAGIGGAFMYSLAHNKPPGGGQVAGAEVIRVPAAIMGADRDVAVNVEKTRALPSDLLAGTPPANSTRRIFIVPQGDDKAAVISTTSNNVKADILY